MWGYETKLISDIEIKGDNEIVIDVVMSPLSNSLDEVVVTTSQKNNSEVAVLAIQKKSINLIDGLSAQSIKKSGDQQLSSGNQKGSGSIHPRWKICLCSRSWRPLF